MALLLWSRIKFSSFTTCAIHYQQYKQLSSGVTTSALRAFYLSVHPDFFAQHPNIQKVNESSLKRLNNYLDSIQCTRQVKNLEPTKVTFYFRKDRQQQEKNNEFKRVHFTLRSHDLLTNIELILASCDLSAEHLKHIVKTQNHVRASLKPQYQKSYGGVEEPKSAHDNHGMKEDIATEIGVRKWLRKHIGTISKQQSDSRSIIESNESLKTDICLSFGIREITWCSPWQHGSEQGILRNLVRLCDQHKDRMKCLHGKTLVFTDQTMTAADGSICLNVEDVPQQWLQFLAKLEVTQSVFYREAEQLDKVVSDAFGNLKVVRPKVRLSRFREHRLVSINEYVSIMGKVYALLQSCLLEDFKPGMLTDLEITYVRSQDMNSKMITVLPNGRLRVKDDCNPYHLENFISQNKAALEKKKLQNASDKMRCLKLLKICQEKLGLLGLTKDFDVDYAQMSECCERLLRNETEFTLVNGLKMRITSNYYSAFDNGQFCIPWNWEV